MDDAMSLLRVFLPPYPHLRAIFRHETAAFVSAFHFNQSWKSRDTTISQKQTDLEARKHARLCGIIFARVEKLCRVYTYHTYLLSALTILFIVTTDTW